MMRRITILGALMLTACGTDGGGDRTAPIPRETPAVAATRATPASAPPPTRAQAPASAVTEKADDFDFAYSYPAAAAAIPALARWLDADRVKDRASIAARAADFRREMAAGGFPFRRYDSTTVWKRVTATPHLLSLSAETYEYTGGAHGSPGFRGLVWDMRTAQPRDPTDLFASEAAVQAAIGTAFCDALDAAREDRRGVAVVRGEGFDNCPKVGEAVMILGSTDGRAIDRIGLLVPPYVAGSFAEGSYDLTLPVTPALLRAVKPADRGAFAAHRDLG